MTLDCYGFFKDTFSIESVSDVDPCLTGGGLLFMSMKNILFMLCLLVLTVACTTKTHVSKSNALEASERQGPDLKKAAKERLSLGFQYLQMGKIERAKHNFDKAMQHDPGSAEVQLGMGWYFEKVKEPDKARKFYKRAIRIDPENGDNLNTYASFLCAQGDYSAADTYFRQAIKQPEFANLAATFENAGLCALKAGDTAKAQNYFERALNHNPEQAKSLLSLAEIWFDKKAYLKSRAFLSRHLDVARSSAQALWLGIRLERMLGDKDALSSYQLQLVRLFPKSREAQLYLSSVSK